MLFGSNEMYALLKGIVIDNKTNYNEVYNALFESIKSYTIKKLKTGFRDKEVVSRGVPLKALDTSLIPVFDYDEIIDEVVYYVLTHIDEFIIRCVKRDYAEAQRQAWLRLQIYYICAKYYKKLSKFPLSPDGELPASSIDEMSLEFRELLTLIIQSVCTYKTNMAEKKMAYIYNAIIFKEFNDWGGNASAKTTLRFMNGKTLFMLKNKMCSLIYDIFSLRLKDKDIGSIVSVVGSKAPTEEGNRVCELTTKKITDWTNRIKMHVISELYKAGVKYGE